MNVLIVSDNLFLVKAIKKIQEQKSRFASIDYCYSKVNRNPDSLIKEGLFEIDVKNDVELIVNKYDLVISAHCKQIFPPKLVNSIRCINVHPGLNPHNRGWYPQVFSILNKKPIGCTIHLMDEKIDHGEIIYQKEVSIFECDTSKDVYDRVVDAEIELLNEFWGEILDGTYTSIQVSDEGNYNSPHDFRELCKLNLDSNGTLREHLDLLRSLSHPPYSNSFFFDEEGNKVYVKIEFEVKSK